MSLLFSYWWILYPSHSEILIKNDSRWQNFGHVFGHSVTESSADNAPSALCKKEKLMYLYISRQLAAQLVWVYSTQGLKLSYVKLIWVNSTKLCSRLPWNVKLHQLFLFIYFFYSAPISTHDQRILSQCVIFFCYAMSYCIILHQVTTVMDATRPRETNYKQGVLAWM